MHDLHRRADIIVSETKAAQEFDSGFLHVMTKNKYSGFEKKWLKCKSGPILELFKKFSLAM